MNIMIPFEPNYFMFFPRIPANCQLPPTIYSILQSIVNYRKEPKTPIKDLAKEGRSKIFNFEYPLTENISKENFEVMILNHYMQRRINFDTVTAFSLQLNVILNNKMPFYNKMFDAVDGWDIFNDGQVEEKDGIDNRQTQAQNETNNDLENVSQTEDISDRRNSELPQNQLEDLRNGSYVTNYNYDKNNSNDKSTSKGKSISNNNTTDNNNYHEIIKRSPQDKISILKEMQENITSIYSLIFKDLDVLFYGIEQ